MSGFFISFLFALGAGVWVYSKMMRSTGGITKNAITVAGVVAFLVFLLLLTIITILTD